MLEQFKVAEIFQIAMLSQNFFLEYTWAIYKSQTKKSEKHTKKFFLDSPVIKSKSTHRVMGFMSIYN